MVSTIFVLRKCSKIKSFCTFTPIYPRIFLYLAGIYYQPKTESKWKES